MGFFVFLRRNMDARLVLLLAGFYTLFNIIYIGKLIYLRNTSEGVLWSWTEMIYYILIDWLIVLGYMTFISISTKRLLERKYSWYRIFLLHAIFSILIGIVIRLVFDLQGFFLGTVRLENYSFRLSLDRFVQVIDLNFLIYFAMIFIIYTYFYLRQVKESEKQRNLLKTQLVNTRMKMLSSQLRPHFLFNTLNSIATLVEVEPKKAQNSIADLSDFLREILYNQDRNTVALEEELRILDLYLNILMLRFSDHLKMEKRIDENLLRHQVPSLVLQPLIENSIKHGYSYDHTLLEITMEVFRQDDEVILKVRNTGAPLEGSVQKLFQKGVGLANINDRLVTLYGDRFDFFIRNLSEGGVETRIAIPYGGF